MAVSRVILEQPFSLSASGKVKMQMQNSNCKLQSAKSKMQSANCKLKTQIQKSKLKSENLNFLIL